MQSTNLTTIHLFYQYFHLWRISDMWRILDFLLYLNYELLLSGADHKTYVLSYIDLSFSLIQSVCYASCIHRKHPVDTLV